MRVLIRPGTYNEKEMALADAVLPSDYYLDGDKARDAMEYAQRLAKQYGALVNLPVEKGVISLAECTSELDAPYMEKAP